MCVKLIFKQKKKFKVSFDVITT